MLGVSHEVPPSYQPSTVHTLCRQWLTPAPPGSLQRLQTELLRFAVQLNTEHTDPRFTCDFKILCRYNFNSRLGDQQADVTQNHEWTHSQHWTYNWRALRNHCCSRKAISITYFQCVSVSLRIQHSKRMRRIILSSVVCPALSHFSTLSHKRTVFEK